MSNLPARSLPQPHRPARRRTLVRSWLLAVLVLTGAPAACVLEDGAAAVDGWQAGTQESALAVTCEPPPPSTDPAVLRRQALAAVTAANQISIDPATGETSFEGCLESRPWACYWLCENHDPNDDPPYCNLCCPGCGSPAGSGIPGDAYPCD